MSSVAFRTGIALGFLLGVASFAPAGEAPRPRTDAHGDSLPTGALARLGTSRFRLNHPQYLLTLSPDGKLLAASGESGMILLLDTATGLEVRQIKAEWSGTRGNLRFSPDGTRLVMAGLRGIHVVDVKTGAVIADFPQTGRGERTSLTFSGDGKLLAAGAVNSGEKQSIAVWDLETKKPIATLSPLHNRLVHAALSHDGKTLATWGQTDEPVAPGGRNGNPILQLWDVATAKELRQITAENGTPVNAAFSPDGRQLAVVESGSALSVWDVLRGTLIRRQAARSGSGAVMHYSPDGKTLVVGTSEGAVQTWEVSTGKRLDLSHGPESQLFAIAFVDGKVLAAGIRNQALFLWDASSGALRSPGDLHTTKITGLAFTRDSKVLVTVAENVRWWNVATAKSYRHLNLRDDPRQRRFGRSELALGPDGKFLSWARRDENDLRIIDVERNEEVYQLQVFSTHQGVASAFTGDGRGFAALSVDLSGGQPATVARVWDLNTGQERRRLAGKLTDFGTLAFSPDGNRVAVAATTVRRVPNPQNEGEVQVWDVDSGKELARIQTPALITTLNFSADGAVLATAGARQTQVELWDSTSGARLRGLETDRQQFCYQVLFSPDGRLLAGVVANSLDRDSRVILWELVSGKVRAEFSGHRGAISALAFAPDGRTLATAGTDTTVLVWNLVGGVEEAGRPAGQLTEQDLADLWSDLESSDARKAHRAMSRLIAAPEQAVGLIRQRVPPAAGKPLEAREVERLLANLDNDSFAVREKSHLALEAAGKSVRPALLEALEGKLSPEKKRRLQELLDAMTSAGPTPELVAPLRALEVLDRLDTPEALRLLQDLGQGNSAARLTHEAQLVLRRLKRQP